jgi:periplasmic copper chaperone A
MKLRTILAATAVTLVLAPVASAHVTVVPDSAPAGGEVRLDLRVPNEEDSATTTKVQLQLPDGFAEASFEPVPGWQVEVKRTPLATPIETDDGEVTEQVSEITWTGDGTTGAIPPGGFQDFPLSVLIPGKEGDTLVFKAVQTYSNGDVVRWIEPPPAGGEEPEHPSPQLSVVAATEEGHDHAAAAATTDETATTAAEAPATTADAHTETTAAAATTSSHDSDSTKTLAVIALIVGLLGLVAGGLGLATARKARTA